MVEVFSGACREGIWRPSSEWQLVTDQQALGVKGGSAIESLAVPETETC